MTLLCTVYLDLSSTEENDKGDQTSVDSENNAVLKEASKIYSQFLDKTVCEETVLDYTALKQLHILFKGFLEQK